MWLIYDLAQSNPILINLLFHGYKLNNSDKIQTDTIFTMLQNAAVFLYTSSLKYLNGLKNQLAKFLELTIR